MANPRRALVTGGTGFIGAHLVTELRHQGWEVVCLVRKTRPSSDAGIRCVQGDLALPTTLDRILRSLGGFDCVFHLGALLPVHQPDVTLGQFMTANALATIELLRMVAKTKTSAFVYASGVTVIGKPEQLPVAEDHPLAPVHPYLISKLAGELACETARLVAQQKVTSLRITSPYGPGMPATSVLPRFIQQAQQSQDLQWFGDGGRTQNFVHVTDVVRACLLAADTIQPGIYNVAGPSSISMRTLAETIVRLTPSTRSHACASGKPDPQDDWRWEIDHSRAATQLGYRPAIGLEQGLSECIRQTKGARW